MRRKMNFYSHVFLVITVVSCLVQWRHHVDGRSYHHKHKNYRKEYLRELLDERRDPYFDGSKFELTAEDLPKNGEIFEGDMLMDNRLRRAVLGLNKKRTAVVLALEGKSKHWPNNEVPFKISTDIDEGVEKQIHKAVSAFKKYTCVTYRPMKPGVDKNYVLFTSAKIGCSSSVGMVGGQQKINLSHGCQRIGTVLHEMMHAIGIIHEQSRSDRDDYLEVKRDNIKPKLWHNFQRYSLDSVDNLDAEYNFNSVMHYSNDAFSKNGKQTLVARSDPSLKFGQRKFWTTIDVKMINKLFGCPNKEFSEEGMVDDMTNDDVLDKKKRDIEMMNSYFEDRD